MESNGDPTADVATWARPGSWVAGSAMVYGLTLLAPAIALVLDAHGSPSALAGWAGIGAFVGWPLALVVSLVVIARERWVTARVYGGRALWSGYVLGSLLVAHWLPMLVWSPAAIAHGMATPNEQRAEAYFESAALGLAAWVLVAIGIGLIAWTRWAFRRRRLVVRPPMLGEQPQWLLGALLFGMLVAPASALVVVAVAEARGSMEVALGAVLTVFAVGALVAVGNGWSVAHADVARARLGALPVHFRESFLRAVGASLLVQGIAVFTMTFLPDWGAALGQQFLVQMVAIALTTVGVALLGGVGLGWWLAAPPEPA